jgi:hypothetical protein
MLDFRRLGRGTKPNIIDGALPNLPKNVLSVQALISPLTASQMMGDPLLATEILEIRLGFEQYDVIYLWSDADFLAN